MKYWPSLINHSFIQTEFFLRMVFQEVQLLFVYFDYWNLLLIRFLFRMASTLFFVCFNSFSAFFIIIVYYGKFIFSLLRYYVFVWLFDKFVSFFFFCVCLHCEKKLSRYNFFHLWILKLPKCFHLFFFWIFSISSWYHGIVYFIKYLFSRSFLPTFCLKKRKIHL